MSAADTRFDVFLSYDHVDIDAVDQLANILSLDFGFSEPFRATCGSP
jgi:hypothetical protein